MVAWIGITCFLIGLSVIHIIYSIYLKLPDTFKQKIKGITGILTRVNVLAIIVLVVSVLYVCLFKIKLRNYYDIGWIKEFSVLYRLRSKEEIPSKIYNFVNEKQILDFVSEKRYLIKNMMKIIPIHYNEDFPCISHMDVINPTSDRDKDESVFNFVVFNEKTIITNTPIAIGYNFYKEYLIDESTFAQNVKDFYSAFGSSKYSSNGFGFMFNPKIVSKSETNFTRVISSESTGSIWNPVEREFSSEIQVNVIFGIFLPGETKLKLALHKNALFYDDMAIYLQMYQEYI